MIKGGGEMVGSDAAGPSARGEAEKCPRCGSQNTKFCYYNNYNLAQPRHFCKACRRYWTVGGSLRNVPVGGSTRRATSQHQSKPLGSPTSASSLRRRSAPAPATAASSPSSSCSSSPPVGAAAPPPSVSEGPSHLDAVRCFESLLAEPRPAGFLALGDPFLGGHDSFALGLGSGQGNEIGYGGERVPPAWPFFGDEGVSSAGGGEQDDDWRVVAGDDGGDCFDWPDMAIGKSAQ